jgi:soluble lytic murein transglycosylase
MLSRYRHTARAWSDPVGRALFRLRLRPNHLTVMGLAVSVGAAAAFVTGHVRVGGVLVALAGLFDFCDGSLARASGQVTPFGAFLDSVIDRYSDLAVLLGIVVLFAGTPHMRGAVAAMAALLGSLMVSYTKARAESIGVECNVGFMERPERMICLIGGALLGVLEPALWVLAVLANITAVHRILFTRRMLAEKLAPAPRRLRKASEALGMLLTAGVGFTAGTVAAAEPTAQGVVPAETERAWTRAIDALRDGVPGPAAQALGSEAALASPIGDYARYVAADALERRGDYAAARAMALSLAERHPQSRLAARALLLSARLAALTGDDAAAQAAIKRLIERYPDARELPQALYMLGHVGEATGQREAAALAYRELRVLAPSTAWANGAEDRLFLLAQGGVTVPPLSIAQRVDRAERLLRGGVAGGAASEAEIIASEAADSGIVLRALRVVADAATRMRRYDLAARAIQASIPRASADRRPALSLELGRLYARGGHNDKALAAYATAAGSGLEAVASEAVYQRARVLRDMGRNAEAVATFRTVAARYPSREVAADALWELGWVAYLAKNPREAEQAWTRITEIPGGRTGRVRALYWAGRARESVAGRPAAERLYQRVRTEAPRSYYGMLAARRGATGAGDGTEPAVKLPADPAEAVAADPAYARVELLRRVGLVEYAWEELDDAVNASVGDTVRLYGLTSAYVRDERYHMVLRVMRRHFTGLAIAGQGPSALWEMLYPFGWRSEIVPAAERVGLDPYLVAAVVREESSYYPRAVSRAGARGLMQLMPATAAPMAETRGWAFRDGALLDDPVANIQMGSSFLASMFREFGDPRLAIAAYNAGPGNVRKWWKARKTDDVEAWVEQIPFDETRNYVKKVTLSWEEYRRLYGGGEGAVILPPRASS